MKRIHLILLGVLALGLMAIPVRGAHAQGAAGTGTTAAATQKTNPMAEAEKMDAGQTEAELEGYTHSAVVQALARHLHISTDLASNLFEDFNSGIVLLCIAWFLWKALPKVFRNRAERLAKQLAEAQKATEDANRVLAEVEARLMRLDVEIEAMRVQMDRASAEDEKKILAAMETERERIIASAEQEIAAAQAGAQRELKQFAAELAIEHAMRRIQLTPETDRALVREFGQGMNGGPGGKA